MKLPIINREYHTAWVPVGEFETLQTGGRTGGKMARSFGPQLRYLTRKMGQRELGARLSHTVTVKGKRVTRHISARTLRSYAWIGKRKRGRWDRMPSDAVQARVAVLYGAMRTGGAVESVGAITGVSFGVGDSDDTIFMALNMAGIARGLSAYNNRQKTPYAQMYFDTEVINRDGVGIMRSEIFGRMYGRDTFQNLLKFSVLDMRRWLQKISKSGKGITIYRMGIRYYN